MSLDTTTIGDGTTMGKGWDGKPGKILSEPWNWAWTLLTDNGEVVKNLGTGTTQKPVLG